MKYEIGAKIKKYREKINLSQKDFAKMINAKNTTVSNWEKGLTRPDVDTLAIICEVLNVSADDLLGTKPHTKEIETLAAHKDGIEWTEEELEDIETFKEYVLSKRKNKD